MADISCSLCFISKPRLGQILPFRDDSSKDADGKLSLRGDFWVTSMGESNGEWGARRDQYVSDSVVLHWAKIKIKGLA